MKKAETYEALREQAQLANPLNYILPTGPFLLFSSCTEMKILSFHSVRAQYFMKNCVHAEKKWSFTMWRVQDTPLASGSRTLMKLCSVSFVRICESEFSLLRSEPKEYSPKNDCINIYSNGRGTDKSPRLFLLSFKSKFLVVT